MWCKTDHPSSADAGTESWRRERELLVNLYVDGKVIKTRGYSRDQSSLVVSVFIFIKLCLLSLPAGFLTLSSHMAIWTQLWMPQLWLNLNVPFIWPLPLMPQSPNSPFSATVELWQPVDWLPQVLCLLLGLQEQENCAATAARRVVEHVLWEGLCPASRDQPLNKPLAAIPDLKDITPSLHDSAPTFFSDLPSSPNEAHAGPWGPITDQGSWPP